jgi:hypothetical protein
LALGTFTAVSHADEGMWTFNNLPLKPLAERYGFTPPDGWVDHLRLASIRMNNGGSASFVSPDGLVITNHHVGSDVLAKLSTPERDLLKLGFYAKTRDEELKAPDLEINVLVGIEDVTERVNARVTPTTDDATAGKLRREAMAEIEKESLDRTGLRSDVVTLYQGGQYHLYTYKKYTDVRLVFAPEFDIAFFGGDDDNFEFPRYDLDICFLRAYENGQPARVEHYLTWNSAGTQEGDLVFVSGHPGRTSRLNTLASLSYLGETGIPRTLELLRSRESNLIAYGNRGEEQRRQAQDDLFGIQNSRKVYIGRESALKDPEFLGRKQAAEKVLRDGVAADPARQAAYGDAWDKLAAAREVAREIGLPYGFLESSTAFDSQLFGFARTLVRWSDEKSKPNVERLREYGDAGLESLKLHLFSEAPIYPELEVSTLAHSLAYWKNHSPADDPTVARVLGSQSPEAVAQSLISGTKLADPSERKRLFDAPPDAIRASSDPMIQLALAIDPEARALRKRYEDEITGVDSAQYARIARALFDLQGDSVYPDATFTLRLAFGTVAGYDVDGRHVAPFTNIAGAFEHEKAHEAKPPYRLPESWHRARDTGALKLDTPMNFVSTNDIIGGNSGSPVVDREGRFVGIIFDGNIQSLAWDYGYDARVARAVSVDVRVIDEALRSVYHAETLLRELGSSK